MNHLLPEILLTRVTLNHTLLHIAQQEQLPEAREHGMNTTIG